MGGGRVTFGFVFALYFALALSGSVHAHASALTEQDIPNWDLIKSASNQALERLKQLEKEGNSVKDEECTRLAADKIAQLSEEALNIYELAKLSRLLESAADEVKILRFDQAIYHIFFEHSLDVITFPANFCTSTEVTYKIIKIVGQFSRIAGGELARLGISIAAVTGAFSLH